MTALPEVPGVTVPAVQTQDSRLSAASLDGLLLIARRGADDAPGDDNGGRGSKVRGGADDGPGDDNGGGGGNGCKGRGGADDGANPA